jgi:tetratricopeptide (TPR) repeat protein
MSRRYAIALLNVWPGLAQIWTGQELLGLFVAAAFAGVLNLALVSRLLWTELFAPQVSAFFAALAVVTWISSLGYTLWWTWQCHPQRYRLEIDALFRDALEAYLQGRWNDARRGLERILAMDENDADALMQLGLLFARTDQPAMARRAFRQCLETDSGSKWRWEIAQALGRLDRPAHNASHAASRASSRD